MTFEAWEPSPPPLSPPNPTTTRYIRRPPSQTPIPHPPPEPTTTSPVPPPPHFPSYLPPVLATLTATSRLPFPSKTHFAHLACSLLTHPTASKPSLVQLKQHTQALCLLISLLQPQVLSNNGEGGPFDFLENLEVPYENEAEAQNQPLESLRDTISSAGHDVSGVPNVPTALACPILTSANTGEMTEHANTLLTSLDDIFAPTGGILSILLPSSSTNRTNPQNPNHPLFPSTNPTRQNLNHPSNPAPHTILHQLLTLPHRLAAHEREIASLRQLLAGEACVPAVRLSQQLQSTTTSASTTGGAVGPGVRELVAGQDRYVLAGLSTALWDRLAEEFRIADGYGSGTRKCGFGAAGVSESLDDDDDGDDGEIGGEGRVTWIECTSRLYRHTHHPETVFVIPAWDVLPGAEKVRQVEGGGG